MHSYLNGGFSGEFLFHDNCYTVDGLGHIHESTAAPSDSSRTVSTLLYQLINTPIYRSEYQINRDDFLL